MSNDISKFQVLVRALEERVRQEYGLSVQLYIHETEEYITAKYKNREDAELFCLVQTFSTPLDQVIEKIDIYFPGFSFPKLAVFYEFLQYDVLLISEDEAGNRVSKRNHFESLDGMNDFLFDCLISSFKGIENITIEKFLKEGYFEKILEIWAEVGEIKKTQINAIKYFSIKYAERSYQGVLEYQFNKYFNQDIHQFVNNSYQQVFKNVKDTIEYQLPRIITLFESLIIRAFEIKNFSPVKPVDLSNIIRFFEIGATTPLGIDMIEKGVPVIIVKKIESIPWGKADLQEQRNLLLKRGCYLGTDYDAYEIGCIQEYIDKYCK